MDYMTNSMSIRLVMPYDSTHSGHHTTPHLRCRRQCPCPPRARVWYMRRRQQELTRSPGQLRTSDRDPRNRQVHRTLASEPDAPRPFRYRPSISKIPHCNGSHAADEGGRGARGGSHPGEEASTDNIVSIDKIRLLTRGVCFVCAFRGSDCLNRREQVGPLGTQ